MDVKECGFYLSFSSLDVLKTLKKLNTNGKFTKYLAL